MSTPERQPAGFCPHCFYPIDAGLCPECGELVEQTKLLDSPRYFRHRLLRSLKYLLIVALVGGVGYGVYHEIQPDRWVRYVSSEYLIELEAGNAGDHVRFELDRRYVKGILAGKPLTTLLQQRIEPRKLRIQSPWPADTDARVQYWFVGCPFESIKFYEFEPSFGQVKQEAFYINDRQVLTEERRLELVEEILPELNVLEVGQHNIKHLQLIDVYRFPYANQSPWVPPTRALLQSGLIASVMIRSTFTYEKTDKPLEALIPGRFDEHRRDEIISNPVFLELYDMDYGQIPASITRLKLAGELRIEPLAPNPIDPTPLIVLIPHDACEALAMIGNRGLDMKHVKVTFTPDAGLAFDFNFEDYFDGIIRWEEADMLNGLGLPDSVEPND